MTLITVHSSHCCGNENRWHFLVCKSNLSVAINQLCLNLLLQAAAHGLPMVATKNGGPVDIHKVQHLLHLLVLLLFATSNNRANRSRNLIWSDVII